MSYLKVSKSIIRIFAITTFVSSSTSFADSRDDLSPREVTVGLSDVYVPSTNRRNENSFVVVSGIFPNGCYRWSRAEVTHVHDYAHEVRAKALVNPGMCLMVLIPFTKEVQLGELLRGEHQLKFLNDDGTYIERTLAVD